MIRYEFYVTENDGADSSNWDLKHWESVKEEYYEAIKRNELDGFRIEISKTDFKTFLTDTEYVEVYPNNETHLLPKYVQKYTEKVLSEIAYLTNFHNLLQKARLERSQGKAS